MSETPTESAAVLYLVRANCPNCRTAVSHAEVREMPVPLDMDVGVRADYCPACGFHVAGHDTAWDVCEESEVERVEPTDPTGWSA